MHYSQSAIHQKKPHQIVIYFCQKLFDITKFNIFECEVLDLILEITIPIQ
jgi:hypothetical protein